MPLSFYDYLHSIDYEAKTTTFLFRALSSARLSHALLFLGEDLEQKKALSVALCLKLLCQNSSSTDEHSFGSCECSSCKRILANNHPNIKWFGLEPSEQLGEFSIELVRQLKTALLSHAYEKGPQIWILTQAHKLTKSAANAFLKTIEEPNAERYIVLFAPSESLLLPTIISRCQKLFFRVPKINTDEEYKIAKSLFCKIDNTTIPQRLTIIDELPSTKEKITSLLDSFSQLLVDKTRANPQTVRTNRLLLAEIMQTKLQINRNGNLRLSLENLIIKAWATKQA